MKKQKGFTIIELIIVIIILGMLILLAAPRFLKYADKARIANITHDIKVAENITAEYLTLNNRLPDDWATVNISNLRKASNENRLYDKHGLTNSVLEEEYKEIDKVYLKDKINTKLKGSFYINNAGGVYYEDNNSVSDKDDLFDRDVDIEVSEDLKFEILDYNFPNGIYRPQDFIKGNIKVKGIEAGDYILHVKMKHAKANRTIEKVIEFNLQKDEIKTLDFDYEVTTTDRIGFYDFNLIIKDNSENLVSYYIPQSVYIVQEEWEYFYEDDFNEVDRPVAGQIGALSPDRVDYEYVEEPSGIDYSSVRFNVEPGDNRSGQVQTKLPISYGTYEAMMKVPDSDALLNGFFLYGDDKYNPEIHYEIDIEVLFYEGNWQAWTTIFNESNEDYEYNGEEPGVIFQKKIDLDFDPSEKYHSYRIDFYDNFVSFAIDGVEIARWDKRFDYGDMYMYAGNFYTHWLSGELSDSPLQMDVIWMRRGYFPQ